MASDHPAKDLRRTSTLTAADTFHGSTFDDEEAGSSSSADFVDNPAAPVSRKNRKRLLLAVPAVLIVMALLIGTMAYLMITAIFQTINSLSGR